MQPVIRPPTRPEAAAIARLWHAGWHDAHAALVPPELSAFRSLDRFQARALAALPRMRVAVDGDRILGMALLHRDEVNQFYVAAQARGTGLAARLMADAETILAARGHARAWLACTLGNTRARRFYEKCGWQVAGTEPLVIATGAAPITITIWRLEKHLAR